MTTDHGERRLLPLACTLELAEGPQRLREWQALVTRAGVRREATPGKVTLIFRSLPGVREDLERLVAAERICCAFLGWDLLSVDGQLHVDVTGTDEELRALPGGWD